MLPQRTFFALTHFSFGRSVRQAAVVCVATAMLAACGGSDDNTGTQIPIRPEPTQPGNSTADATPVTVGSPITATGFDPESPDEEHHFQVTVSEPGSLTVEIDETGGRSDERMQVRAEDRDGNRLEVIRGSWIVVVTEEVVSSGGGVVIIIVSAVAGSGGTETYSVATEYEPMPMGPQTTTPMTSG